MTADPRDAVSGFTEITDEELLELIGWFFRAVGWGAMAGGGIFLILTVPAGLIALFAAGLPAALLFAVLPLVIGFAGTAIGMIVLGLPLTWLLRSLHRERATTYAIVGLFGGFLFTVLVCNLFVGGSDRAATALTLFLGLFGAIAGSVCGKGWGTYRESLAQHRHDGTEPSTNPYHDMIY